MVVASKKKSLPILMYHSISDHASQKYKPFAVTPTAFAEQMAYLHEQHYTTLTVTQFIDARANEKELPERIVLITFDDGFVDFYTAALPVLQRYHQLATIYIATAFTGGTSRWLRQEGEGERQMLSWEQIVEISGQGMECGGHTHTHPQLDILPEHMARDEITRCKHLLEERLGQEIFSFAYPHGYHSTNVKKLVREAGYTSACAVKYQMCAQDGDPFALARLIVAGDTTIEAFAALLTSPIPSMSTQLYKQARVPLWRLARALPRRTP